MRRLQTVQEQRRWFRLPHGGLDPSTRLWLLSSSRLGERSCGHRPAIRWLRSSWPGKHFENLRQQQASALAYFDTFWMMAVLTFAVAFLVLFMKRSVAEKGARVASE